MATFATHVGVVSFIKQDGLYTPCDRDGEPVDDNLKYQYDKTTKTLKLQEPQTRHKRGLLDIIPISSNKPLDELEQLIMTRFISKPRVNSADILALSRKLDDLTSRFDKEQTIKGLVDAMNQAQALLQPQVKAELQDTANAWNREISAHESILAKQLPEIETLIDILLIAPEVGKVRGQFFYSGVHGFFRLPAAQRIRALEEIHKKLDREISNTIRDKSEIELRVKQIEDLVGDYIPHYRLEGRSVTTTLVKDEYIKILKNVKSKSDTVLQLRQLHEQDHEPVDPTLVTHVETKFNLNLVGIPLDHALKMQQVSSEMKTVFGIRPVDAAVRQLIVENYPTKDIRVKGKSSNWGPMNGFICVNQALSKKEGHEDTIRKQNQAIQDGLKKGHFTKTQLVISKKRIDQLEELGSIRVSSISESGNLDIAAQAYRKGQSGNLYTFIAIPTREAPEKYSIFHRHNDGSVVNDEPVEVVAEPHLQEALTADYDLFFVATTMEEFGADDQRNWDAVDQPEVRRGSGNLLEIPRRFSEGHGKPLGAISERTRKLMDKINKELNRGQYREMVHHGEDAGNPVSDMADNFPATFYLPDKLTGNYLGIPVTLEPVTVLKNIRDYQMMVSVLKENGYHFTDNPKWPQVRRPSYAAALAQFRARSNSLLKSKSKSLLES